MSTNLVGQVLLGQFRVDQFIAAGGMGAVYKVYDLKRNVYLAMKILQPELLDDPAMMGRFQREADVLMSLAHPNIVPFYGVFRTHEIVFLVERFIDGPTLQEYLRRIPGKTLPIGQVLKFLRALSSALSYAHNNGVVHCDIKSGNVMIDQGGNIYLADFGIARHAGSTTTNYGVAGTPAYMAPEQLVGQSVSPATDVYALGVLLFELVTGQRPFKGNDPASAQAGETITDRLRFEHLRLSPPDPTIYNRDLSPQVADVILKTLEKNPGLRYHDVMHLYEDFCQACGVFPETVSERIILEGVSTAQTVSQSTEVDMGVPSPRSYQPVATTAATPQPDPWDRPLRRQTIVVGPPREKKRINPWLVGCLGVVTLLGIVGITVLVVLLFFSPGLPGLFRFNNLFPTPTIEEIIEEPTSSPPLLPTLPLSPTESLPPTQAPLPTQPPTAMPQIRTPLPPTPTSRPFVEDFTSGVSVNGLPLRWKRIGLGPKSVVVIGNIHGSESNTGSLVNLMEDQVDWWVKTVGADKRVFFLPQANPDGVITNQYFNAHGVDLNRNWQTRNWNPNATGIYGKNVAGKGGNSPFSEPETSGIRDFLLFLQDISADPLIVISYHAATAPGVVQPSYILNEDEQTNDPRADVLARDIAAWMGYQYIERWTAYAITGELINWCGEHDIVCIDIELPNRDTPNRAILDRHLQMFAKLFGTRW